MRDTLRRLATQEASALPFISAYIDLTPEKEGGNQSDHNLKGRDNNRPPKKSWRREAAETRQYRSGVTAIRKLLEEKGKQLPERGPERDSFDGDAEKIREYIEGGFETSARSAAIFACSGDNLWEVIELPVPVDTEVYVGQKPSLGQLAFLDDTYDRYALCLADSVTARIYVISLGKPEELETVEGEQINRTMTGGWSQRRIQQRIENAVSDHMREVVQKLEEMVFAEDIPWIIFGGDPIARTEFDRYLSDRARQRLIEINNMDTDLPEQEALEQSLQAMQEAEHKGGLELARLAVEEAQGQGLGLTTLEDILVALRDGAVDTLVLDTAWNGETTDTLALSQLHLAGGHKQAAGSSEAAGEGETLTSVTGELPNLREEMISAALRTDAAVEFVEGSELLDGGVAALLRWRPGELPGGVRKPEATDIPTTSHKQGEQLNG